MALMQSPPSAAVPPSCSNKPQEKISTPLKRVWAATDAILGERITSETGLKRPIGVRQPYLFYLGHLPAFAWNLLVEHYNAGEPVKKEWDDLFARGIDPSLVLSATAKSPEECTWPAWTDIIEYRDLIRFKILQLAREARLPPRAARIIVEHEAMHAETLTYMLVQDAANLPVLHPRPRTSSTPDGPEWIRVPGGRVTLGAGADPSSGKAAFSDFRWDNEFGLRVEHVRPFLLSRLPVTVAQFAAFIDSGGYSAARFWGTDWDWVRASDMRHPASWRRAPGSGVEGLARWNVLTRDGPVSAEAAADWPVSVSAVEASAYAVWAGGRVVSEAEWVRAAYGEADAGASKEDEEACGLDGGRPPHARAVGHGAASWCGVYDLGDNGWEITSSVFEPFPGFHPMQDYPGYSTDFFDGDHIVLRGRSWVTDNVAARASFRNYFRRRYRYAFTKFRLCRDVEKECTEV